MKKQSPLQRAARRRIENKQQPPGNNKGRGFKEVARGIANDQNIPQERANAILATRSRAASALAKRRNPALNRVK
jgi:hypothetical protein